MGGSAADLRSQTLTKDAVLVGGDGDKITLGAPASVDAQKLLLPGTLGVANSLLYITSVGGSTVSTSWIPPGNTGDVLAYVSGALTWTPVASLPALTFWSLLGNGHTVVDGTNNLLGTTTAAPLRLITGGTTRVTIGATGGMTVAGTSGTSNVTMTSLASATGTTGRVMFATDATGALNALALPASSGQILTSTTGGVLSWTSSPTLNFWSLSGNSGTTAWNGATGNFLGTTDAQPLSIATTNATAQNISFYTGANGANERFRIGSTGNLSLLTSGGSLAFQGTSTGTSTFKAGAQGTTTINYTLPITQPTTNQILTASAISGSGPYDVTLSWAAAGSSSGWALTGNSGTTAGTNFIGTTDAVDWVIKTGGSAAGNERARVTAGGRIGVGNISDVRTTVDINGDYGTRYTSLSLSNGGNNNINPGAYSYVRITGPTANFSITGMRSGANGKRITLYNTTSYTMDFDYESTSSIDTTRFHNPIATDVTIYAGGSASFIYDAVLNRWVLTSYTNGFVPQISSQILRRKSADETISAANTTLQDDDHLQWPVVAGQIWEVRGVLFVEAATANPDFRFQFVAPGGTGDSLHGYWRLYKLGGGGGGSLNDADLITDYSTPSTSMRLNAATVYSVELNGVFVVGNTSGDIKMQWSKTTAVADNLTVRKNSYLFITRIE